MLEQITNKIINADCLDILRELPDKCIELVLTDPPYGINVIKTGKIGGVNKARSALPTDYGAEDWDEKPLSQEEFDEICRVSKNQIIFGGNYFIDKLKKPSPCWLIWDKDNTGDFADAELAYTSSKSPIRIYKWRWNGMLQQDMRNKEIRIHPTQKPVRLFEKIINDYYNKESGGIVADFYSGSGTTAIACHNLKIPFVCTEKNPKYFAKSVERLENVKAQLRLNFD